MNNRILHIIPYEKFTADYVNEICRLFDYSRHVFYVYGVKTEADIRSDFDKKATIIFESKFTFRGAFRLVKMCRESRKVIIHSLFLPPLYLIAISLFIKKFGDKTFWDIWGADLYDTYESRKKNFAHRAREVFRKRFIKNIAAVGDIPGDYDYLKERYKTNATFYLASYIYDFPALEEKERCGKTCNILLGNSANPSCCYPDALEKLSVFKEEDIKIFCILSYPKNEKRYIASVIEKGKDIFGEKFIPITEFMPYEEYMQLLNKIDIAVFNNNRQQALGNIAGLLFYGKRVYLNKQNACYDHFNRIGAKLFLLNDLKREDIRITEYIELKERNQKVIEDFFSDEEFYKRWNVIFESDYKNGGH